MFSHLYGLPCDHSVKAHDVRVELLGAHADLEIRMFNVVAFKGLKCNEYLGSRCLSSTLLTFIKVSPTFNDELKEPVTVDGEPDQESHAYEERFGSFGRAGEGAHEEYENAS
jgi:hypothetical protein